MSRHRRKLMPHKGAKDSRECVKMRYNANSKELNIMSRHKYPHTPHFSFSRSKTDDDKVLANANHFAGQLVVATMKMDGENTSLYRDGFHARSLDSRHHGSRDWVAAFHAKFAHEIKPGWRVCGENLYARHSVGYDDLPSYFMGFSVWNENNEALAWDETVSVLDALGIEPVPVIYRGLFDEKLCRKWAKEWDAEKNEGFVVRLDKKVAYEDFGLSCAKWVRQRHVQTNDHWMHQAVVPNGLAR